MSSAAVIIAGLAVGVTFVVVFSLIVMYVLPRNSIFVEPPPMFLTVERSSDRQQYEGGVGSYCGRDFCADATLALVVPDKVISIPRGSEIAFEVADYRQPDELDIYILDSQYDQTADLRLRKTTTTADASGYIIDMLPGEYILDVRAAWQEPSRHDAVYHYRVNVTTTTLMPDPQPRPGILSRDDAITMALNDTHGIESRNQADITTNNPHYVDDGNGGAFEVDADALEKTLL